MGASKFLNNAHISTGPKIAKPYIIEASVTTLWKLYCHACPCIQVFNHELILDVTAIAKIKVVVI